MENNEIMNYEDVEINCDDVNASESSGVSTGVAMLIGAGVACAVGACVKLVKKGIAKHKAKKELRMHEDFVDVDDAAEDVKEVATK
jgi:hypothetical protein